MNTRQRDIELLKQIYLQTMVEDPQDGTDFDCDVLDALNNLQEKYKDTSCCSTPEKEKCQQCQETDLANPQNH